MKKILLFLSASIVVVSCSKLSENEFEVAGTIAPSLNGKNAILQKQGGITGMTPLDTVKIADGKFLFKGKAESPEIHFVTIEGVPNVGLDFILEEGSINLAIDKDSLQKSKRSGTYNNEKLQEFIVENNKALHKIEAEQQAFRDKNKPAYMAAQAANDSATMTKLTEELMSFEKKKSKYSEEFVKKNPKAFITVLLLKQLAASTALPSTEIEKLYEALDPELKKGKEGKELLKTIDNLKKAEATNEALKVSEANVEVGKIAPDFSAPGPDGKKVSLKQSMGKVTLIDFWASWCGPCRKENPHVVAIYNELHSKGFNIIGVSLDKPGEAAKWQKAIADDKLTWTQVSNLQEWNEPIALQYGVRGIPATFLLDASGKIVAKNLMGEELKAKIKELLAK